MMARMVDAVDERRALRGARGAFAVTEGAIGVEQLLAREGCLGKGGLRGPDGRDFSASVVATGDASEAYGGSSASPHPLTTISTTAATSMEMAARPRCAAIVATAMLWVACTPTVAAEQHIGKDVSLVMRG